MQLVMPQPSCDQQTSSGIIRLMLERWALCTSHLATDLETPGAEREAAATLRLAIVCAALSTSMAGAGVVSAALDIVPPVNIGVGGSVILILAYLQQLCAPAEFGLNLAVIPALRSRRLRVLRLAEAMIDAVTIALLYVAGSSLIVWSMVELL